MDEKLGKLIEDTKLELNRKKFHKPNYCSRPRRTKEELADFLKTRNIKSQCKLMANRDEGKPEVYDYVKAYGTWSGAIREIFGDARAPRCPPLGHLVVKAILEFDISTFREYSRVVKARPDIFPSGKFVIKSGGWVRYLKVARRMSLNEEMTKCLNLAISLGREPKIKELRDAGINFERIFLAFKSYTRFISFLKELRKNHENRIRSRGKGKGDDKGKVSGEKEDFSSDFRF